MKSRIGYFCGSSSWGGLEMNQLKNARWMQERGHTVFLICLKNSPIENAAIENRIHVFNVDKHKKYYDFKVAKQLSNIINELKLTHFIIRDTHDMRIAVMAKKRVKRTLHLSYFMEMQLGVKKVNPLQTIRYMYFNCWSCPLSWLEEQVLTMTHIKKSKVRVIPSGIELDQFKNLISQDSAREKLDLPLDRTIFGVIGRIDPQKGQLLVLKALKELSNNSIAVCFMGDPTKDVGETYLSFLKNQVIEFGLEEQVYFRSFRKDIATFFSAVDATIMASKSETFGMVTIESMACGTPVIASNAGGSPEILDWGRLGLLFEPENAISLARKIDMFCKEPNSFSLKSLKEEALKYSHVDVCEKVEMVLGIR